MLLEVISVVLAALVGLKIYVKVKCGRYSIKQRLSNRNFLITGASAGIGKASARILAHHGATVHMLCRNRVKAESVAESIRSETGNSRVHVWTLDTSSLLSVREFAEKFLKTNEEPIHVLINNAGIGAAFESRERTMTKDGLELTMATNHFGHFLLTNLLLDRIKNSAPARIVNVSPMAHQFYDMDLNDVNLEKGQSGMFEAIFQRYCVSKLANVMFTRELARRVYGTGVTTNALHPGFVATDIGRAAPNYWKPLQSFIFLFAKSIDEGAATTLYLATSPEVAHVNGHYFSDCKPDRIRLQALDDDVCRKFWDISAEQTNKKTV